MGCRLARRCRCSALLVPGARALGVGNGTAAGRPFPRHAGRVKVRTRTFGTLAPSHVHAGRRLLHHLSLPPTPDPGGWPNPAARNGIFLLVRHAGDRAACVDRDQSLLPAALPDRRATVHAPGLALACGGCISTPRCPSNSPTLHRPWLAAGLRRSSIKS